MTNIWTPNGNRVAALPPGSGDLFVVTTLFGQRITVEPVSAFDAAVARAEAFARGMAHDRPFTVKVLCMSFRELLAAQGLAMEHMRAGYTHEDEAEDRQRAIEACTATLRDSNDPTVRADAFEVLTSMGVIKQ